MTLAPPAYRLEAVTSSRGAAFDEAYAALHAEFGPRGELERREVIARWLEAAGGAPPLERTYHLLVARDEAGAFAGVRDCHVTVDRREGLAVVYLAHVLVLPAYRRTGLAARLREAPLALGRRALDAAGLHAPDAALLLAAEMEPPRPGDLESLVRLVAYGKDGFSAVAPAALPYRQPDFRALAAGSEPRPIPLLAVVRLVGHEGAARLPARLARAFVTHLYTAFATHVRAEHLDALRAETLTALDVALAASARDDVPLVALPRTIHDDVSPLGLPSNHETTRSHDDHPG